MENFKAITTQEEFDKMIADRLKREADKYQEKISKLEEENTALKEQVSENGSALESSKTELEELTKAIAEKESKISSYELAKLKTTIALKNGIPYDLADRITGSNEEELLEDAKRLAEFVSKPTATPPLKSTEPKGSAYDSRDAALLKMTKNLTNKGE